MDNKPLGRTGTNVALIWLMAVCLAGVTWADDDLAEATKLGQSIAGFSLADFRGKTHTLSDYDEFPVVVLAFLGTECPLVRLYGPRLNELADHYRTRGVQFLGINANCQDTITEIDAYARRYQVEFPILKDLRNELADDLGAQRTPEVFVLDRDRKIRYQGRIDNQYGVGYLRAEATRSDLREALEDLLAGRPIRHPSAPAVGCLIGRLPAANPDAEITYGSHIAKILRLHCVECHRNGEIAPFSLTSYDEVAGWAETIAEVVRDQRMPPWHADPRYGEFVNARVMTETEKQRIYDWAADGAPQGEPSDLPALEPFVSGWRLPRSPDQIIAMRDRPFQVPAQGTVEYQYFVVDPGFERDQWVSAAELRPGNRSVVHHAIVFVRPPEGVEQEGVGWLTAYVPGNARIDSPPGHARLIPAGSKLIFQLHYTPVGTEQPDITRLGLVFADPVEVEFEVMTLIALQRDFEIPPQSASYRVETDFADFPRQAKLLALGPHMHVRGKSFRFIAERANQPPEILLDVPRYDFNWQHVYQFQNPVEVADQLTIKCVAHFDNSEENLANPDPSATVRWGDQTWEEMVLGYLEVAVPVELGTKAGLRLAERRQKQLELAEGKARRWVERFDQDGSGDLTRDELPQSFNIFAFRKIDKNKDSVITFQEAVSLSIDPD